METKKIISDELHKERKKEERLREHSRPKISKSPNLPKSSSLDETVKKNNKSSSNGLEDFLDAAAESERKTKKRRRSKKLTLQMESLDISTL